MTTFNLKSFNEIGTDAHFFIPSYQRGYRWDRTQVLNLLEDLYEFMNMATGTEFYCLQPVVVRNDGLGMFEVIDGQQRLTTISLLLRCLNYPAYQLTYESRPNSQDMLENIRDYSTQEATNIDHHYFKEAYITIQAWLKEKSRQEMTLGMKLFITLGERVKVIWYEVDQSANAYDLFLKLNVGKIPLTNAELIKAVLLQSRTEHERIELSLEWEEMERRLQDDSFWYFLSAESNYENRIELLFDVLVQKTDHHHDAFYTFDQVLIRPNFWQEVRDLYARLNEWYDDRAIYHFVGYLTHVSKQKKVLPEFISLYRSETVQSKEDFTRALRRMVKNSLPDSIEELYTLHYDSDKQTINNVLLLFNLAEEMKGEHGSSRFPFHYYKQEKWSLEHIHAQKTDQLKSRKQWDAWLKDTRILLGTYDLLEESQMITAILEGHYSERDFFDFVQMLELRLAEKELSLILTDDQLNGLGNMALLSQTVNASLSNHYYPIKFEKLKAYERKGGYLPPATRKAFWKYYTDQPTNFEFWTTADQEGYSRQIIQSIQTFTNEEIAHVHA